jgi:hypothetical protein
MPTPTTEGNPMPMAPTAMGMPSYPQGGMVTPTGFQPGYYPAAYPGYGSAMPTSTGFQPGYYPPAYPGYGPSMPTPGMPMYYGQQGSPAFNAFSGN